MTALAFHAPHKLNSLAAPLPDSAPAVSETPTSAEAFFQLLDPKSQTPNPGP